MGVIWKFGSPCSVCWAVTAVTPCSKTWSQFENRNWAYHGAKNRTVTCSVRWCIGLTHSLHSPLKNEISSFRVRIVELEKLHLIYKAIEIFCYFLSHFYLSLITKSSLPVTTLIDFVLFKEKWLTSRKFSLSIQKQILHSYKNFSKNSAASHKFRICPTIFYLKFHHAFLDTESLNEIREIAGACVTVAKAHSDNVLLFLCILTTVTDCSEDIFLAWRE